MSESDIYRLLERILDALEANGKTLSSIQHEISQQSNMLNLMLIDLNTTATAILTAITQPEPIDPTSITFTEDTMNPPVAGNVLVYTGTLAPAGAVFPTDSTFALVSSDPTVTPTVDPTGLIVTIALPSTFVDDPNAPFHVDYTATSASTGMALTATITPSIPTPPPVVPTSITFSQTS